MDTDASSTSASAGEPSPSAELRDQSDRIWAGLHAHPFLGELARGVLPLEKFRFFVEQDVMYLPDFARCIAAGAAKSATEAELAFFARQLDSTINLELPNQYRVLEQVCRLGAADCGGALGKAPATVAYTGFMLSVARSRSWLRSCPVPGATPRSRAVWRMRSPITPCTGTGSVSTQRTRCSVWSVR